MGLCRMCAIRLKCAPLPTVEREYAYLKKSVKFNNFSLQPWSPDLVFETRMQPMVSSQLYDPQARVVSTGPTDAHLVIRQICNLNKLRVFLRFGKPINTALDIGTSSVVAGHLLVSKPIRKGSFPLIVHVTWKLFADNNCHQTHNSLKHIAVGSMDFDQTPPTIFKYIFFLFPFDHIAIYIFYTMFFDKLVYML